LKDDAGMKMQNNVEITPGVAKSRRLWMIGAAVVSGLAGAGVAWWRLSPQPASVGDVDGFWQLGFDKPSGGELRMTEFKGRALLVNFWATWCPPCVEELPLLESFWRENGAKNLQVLGLAVDQPSSVRKFLQQNALTFPMGLAGLTGTELARSLGNSVGALPFSALFNAQGQLIAQKMGKLEPSDLADWLKVLK
jgi:thiol-disulfide isomerase/thioredoxin